jgi:hypothetical protein
VCATAVDIEFRRLICDNSPSPYAFKLTASSAEEDTSPDEDTVAP